MTSDLTNPRAAGFATGHVAAILRLEGALVLLLAVLAYGAVLHGGWGRFALLFLLPDLSMLGYLINRRVGAAAYNLGHSHALPVALAGLGCLAGSPTLVAGALIWIAHIGFDRMLGYGLKYPDGFGHTHLGLVGVQNTPPQRAKLHSCNVS